MFQQQMKKYKLEKPSIIYNELNEPVTTYTFDREIEMAIALDTKSYYNGNGAEVTNVEYTAMTRYPYLNKGDRIGEKYIVLFVESNRLFSIVHLREIDSNGRYSN